MVRIFELVWGKSSRNLFLIRREIPSALERPLNKSPDPPSRQTGKPAPRGIPLTPLPANAQEKPKIPLPDRSATQAPCERLDLGKDENIIPPYAHHRTAVCLGCLRQ